MARTLISNDLLMHLSTQKDRDEFKKIYLNSNYVLDPIRKLVQEYSDQVLASETKLDDFEDPNWSHKQAFRNGQRQAYRKLLELLKVETK